LILGRLVELFLFKSIWEQHRLSTLFWSRIGLLEKGIKASRFNTATRSAIKLPCLERKIDPEKEAI
ncbi:hypothetical protein N9Y41_04595, partial [Planktomarina temperata]|nr:hypothetical protein [Planktomarina temperata]